MTIPITQLTPGGRSGEPEGGASLGLHFLLLVTGLHPYFWVPSQDEGQRGSK